MLEWRAVRSGIVRWICCLALAAFVAAGVGTRSALADGVEDDDAGLSMPDEDAAVPPDGDASLLPAPVRPLAFDFAPVPLGRLAVSDLFRPPIAPAR